MSYRINRVLPSDSLPRILWRIRRFQPSADMWHTARFLAEFGRSYPWARFVQIGSNDGMNRDPLRPEIYRWAWRGVLTEPVPHIYRQLRKNYRDISHRLQFENAAVTRGEQSLPFYYLEPVPDPVAEGLPDFYELLGSFNKEVLLSHKPWIPDLERRVRQTDVRCLSFAQLCEKNKIQCPDLLHIDAEGYDFEILQGIDLDRYHPTLLIYEHHHLSREDTEKCSMLLSSAGYELVRADMDTWCFRTRELHGKRRRLYRHWQHMIRSLEGANAGV